MPGEDGAPELVCFDLGGVVVRIASGWAEAAQRAGVMLPPSAAAGIDGRSMARLIEQHETGRLGADAFYRAVAALSGLSADRIAAIHDAWLIEPYEGIGEILTSLRRRGIATACLSNTSARHWRLIHGDGPQRVTMALFDHRFASHLIGVMKPDEASFAHVERATGIEPTGILFFDDNPANITAATARGWRAHLIAPHADPARQVRQVMGRWPG